MFKKIRLKFMRWTYGEKIEKLTENWWKVKTLDEQLNIINLLKDHYGFSDDEAWTLCMMKGFRYFS